MSNANDTPATRDDDGGSHPLSISQQIHTRCRSCNHGKAQGGDTLCRHQWHPGYVGGCGTEWALTCSQYSKRESNKRVQHSSIGGFMNAIGSEQEWADALRKSEAKLSKLIEELRSLQRYDMEAIEYRRTKFRDSHAVVSEVQDSEGEWVKWEDVLDLIRAGESYSSGNGG